MTSETPRILIVRLSAIGDVIQGLPVLNALRDRFPRSFLAWVVEEKGAPILRGVRSDPRRPRCQGRVNLAKGAFMLQKVWSLLRHPRRCLRDRRLRRMAPEQVFTEIYRKNAWRSAESVSGLGSALEQTVVIRRELPALVREFGWRSMLDLPCGDFHWLSRVQLDLDYLGADVVEELVLHNQARHGRDGRRFVKLDLLADALPAADLVLCRDCLVHFSHADVRRALANLRASGSRFLLTTTHVHAQGNRDIPTGAFWPLDLQAPPFLLPRPIRLIDEHCTHRGSLGEKCLGLWRMADVVPRTAAAAA